jgi:hypothetical protein
MPFAEANGFALSIPETESWSVILIAARPEADAFATISSGEKIPSEHFECMCKSAFSKPLCPTLLKLYGMADWLFVLVNSLYIRKKIPPSQ